MQHEWGTALGMLLAERGLGPTDVLRRLKERGVAIAPEAVEDWLANRYVPGVGIWLRLGEALALSPEEQEVLRSGVCLELPGEREKIERLRDAARAGDLSMLPELLRTGVMIDRCGTSACLPFVEAVKCGQFAVARYLLEHGSDPNSSEIGGEMPLTIADKLGREDLIRLLIDHGAYGGTDCATGRTALHILARFPGDDDIARARRVIEQGVSVNERYGGGPTPLIEAMRASNWGMCRLLLEHGATFHPGDAREFGGLLDTTKAADPALARQIDAIDPRPKPPFPRWFNEARAQGIERIEYVREKGLTFDINATDPEKPLLVGDGYSGTGAALSPAEFLADPSSARQLQSYGLDWLVPHLKKMADGTHFGINELLRGNARIIHRRKPKPNRLSMDY